MEDLKWGSMDLNDLDSQRLGSQRLPDLNPFDVESTTDPQTEEDEERNGQTHDVTITLPRGSMSTDYSSFVTGLTHRGTSPKSLPDPQFLINFPEKESKSSNRSSQWWYA